MPRPPDGDYTGTPYLRLTRRDSFAHPVVCAINGICQGGGFMIAPCSDVAVAAEGATFRVPELLRGIADLYYAQMLPRIVGPVRARDLTLTGRTLTARDAVDWGLIARVVPDEQLVDAATELLRECATSAPEARLRTKRVLDLYMGLYDRIGMAASLRGDEFAEGVQAFSQRRVPEWVPQDLRRPGRL